MDIRKLTLNIQYCHTVVTSFLTNHQNLELLTIDKTVS